MEQGNTAENFQKQTQEQGQKQMQDQAAGRTPLPVPGQTQGETGFSVTPPQQPLPQQPPPQQPLQQPLQQPTPDYLPLLQEAEAARRWREWWESRYGSQFSNFNEFDDFVRSALERRSRETEEERQRQRQKEENEYWSVAQTRDYISQRDAAWQQLLAQRDAYWKQALEWYVNAFQQQLNQYHNALVERISKKLIPEAIATYDKIAEIRSRKGDPDVLNKLAQAMAQNGVSDIDQAYRMVYGQDDLKAEIEKAKEEARRQAMAEMQNRNLSVLSGGGAEPYAPKVTAPSSMEEAKRNAFNKIVNKYGSGVV